MEKSWYLTCISICSNLKYSSFVSYYDAFLDFILFVNKKYDFEIGRTHFIKLCEYLLKQVM